jgi:hypothetical protein
MSPSNASSICPVAMLSSNGTDGRTDGRTNEEPYSPTRDTSSSVTRAPAYGFAADGFEGQIPCPVCGTLMPANYGPHLARLYCSKRCAGRGVRTLAHLAEIRHASIIANRDVDDVVVTRLLAGVPVTSTRSERIEAVAYLTLRGRSAVWIAAQLHITTRSVGRYRAELNQPRGQVA